MQSTPWDHSAIQLTCFTALICLLKLYGLLSSGRLRKVLLYRDIPYPKSKGWGWGGDGGKGICEQSICYHVAAFMILFNVICNMTMFWKSWIMTYWPHPQGREVGGGGGSAGKIFATKLLHSWFSYIWYATWPCFKKNEFWPTDTIPRVGGWGE